MARSALACALRGAAPRTVSNHHVWGARSFATGGAVAHAEPLVSDLVLRALLRNMKLLVGQRGEKTHFKLLMVAPHDAVANHLAKLEPALDIRTVRLGTCCCRLLFLFFCSWCLAEIDLRS